MKHMITAACLVALVAPVPAQCQTIGVYSDPGGTCCIMYETVYATSYVYVVHTGGQAIASQFRVQNNWTKAVPVRTASAVPLYYLPAASTRRLITSS